MPPSSTCSSRRSRCSSRKSTARSSGSSASRGGKGAETKRCPPRPARCDGGRPPRSPPKPLPPWKPVPTQPGSLYQVAVVDGRVAPSVPAPPLPATKKVVYIDYRDVNWSDPGETILNAASDGFNIVILAFFLSGSGSADMCKAWEWMTPEYRANVVDQLHTLGARLAVSAAGGTDIPYGLDPASYGTAVATWAYEYVCDDIDFDLEWLGPGFIAPGLPSAEATIQWMVDATVAAMAQHPTATIFHAPQLPYFSPEWCLFSGGYVEVYNRVPGGIRFLCQAYNQGVDQYVSYNTLFVNSGTNYPGSAIAQIRDQGIPLEDLIVGKPTTTSTASNGWVPGSTLGSWFDQAQLELGWNAGLMLWDWGRTDAGVYLSEVYP